MMGSECVSVRGRNDMKKYAVGMSSCTRSLYITMSI